MKELSRILGEATRAISAEYFLLPVHGGPSVYRERVYCYELYHQMRIRWPNPDESPYRLNGEVDKAGHELLAQVEADRAKPDLLVHGPGNMSLNHAIIEVKAARAQPDGIKKDLTTLSLFRNRVGYERAIYLFFGAEGAAVVQRTKMIAANTPDLAPIELWLHVEVGTPARSIMTLSPPRRAN